MKANHRVLFASVLLAAVAAQSAAAADLPPRPVFKARPVAAPVDYWTGFYVAAGGGYGNFDARSTGTGDPGGAPFAASNGNVGGRGGFGTVQVGVDYQFVDRWVAGVFADYDFASINGDLSDQVSGSVLPLKETSAYAIGGRFGYLFNPQTLIYLDSGYAHAHFKGGNGSFAAPPLGASGVTLPSQNYAGWFVGGGGEVMVASGWFMKAEYRYASYDSKTFADVVGPPSGLVSEGTTIKPTVQTVRAELVYRFNWGH